MANFEENPIKSGSPFSEKRFQDNEKRFQDGEKRFEDKIDFSKETSFGASSHASFQDPKEEKKLICNETEDKPDDIQYPKTGGEPEIKSKEIVIPEQTANNSQRPEPKKYTAQPSKPEQTIRQNDDTRQTNDNREYESYNANETYQIVKEVKARGGWVSLFLAVAALIFSCVPVLSLIIASAAIFVAKKYLRSENNTRKSLAVVGIVLSALAIFVSFIVIVT